MALLDKFKKNKKDQPKEAQAKPIVPPLKSEMKEPPLKTEAKKKEVKAGKKIDLKGRKIAHEVLVRPLITEKATNLSGENKYVFAVNPKANKVEIKKAITQLYGVKPVAVNILNQRGKNVRYGRVEGQTKAWKKAVIALKEGETIKVFEV